MYGLMGIQARTIATPKSRQKVLDGGLGDCKIVQKEEEKRRQDGRQENWKEGAYRGRWARKVEKWRDRLQVTCTLDAKARARVAILNVLQSVVVEVDVVCYELASDVLPINAGIIRTGHSLVECLATNGPPGLSNLCIVSCGLP